MTKLVLHRVTGWCELERICHKERVSSARIRMIGNSSHIELIAQKCTEITKVHKYAFLRNNLLNREKLATIEKPYIAKRHQISYESRWWSNIRRGRRDRAQNNERQEDSQRSESEVGFLFVIQPHKIFALTKEKYNFVFFSVLLKVSSS